MASSTVARSRQPDNPRPPHGPIDNDDALAIRAAEMAAWARRNVKVIIGVAAVVLVLVAGYVWYRMDQAREAERAAQEFLTLEQTVDPNNLAAAAPALQRFIARFGGTPEAAEARLRLAELYLENDQPQNAVPVLRELAGGRSPFAFQGTMLLAQAQGEAGDREAAVATFLQAAERAALDFQRYEALSEAALLREQAGNLAGAAELYRRILSEVVQEGTLEEGIVQMRLAEVEARAGAAPAAATRP